MGSTLESQHMFGDFLDPKCVFLLETQLSCWVQWSFFLSTSTEAVSAPSVVAGGLVCVCVPVCVQPHTTTTSANTPPLALSVLAGGLRITTRTHTYIHIHTCGEQLQAWVVSTHLISPVSHCSVSLSICPSPSLIHSCFYSCLYLPHPSCHDDIFLKVGMIKAGCENQGYTHAQTEVPRTRSAVESPTWD